MSRRLLVLMTPLALVAVLGAWAWTQSVSAVVLSLPTELSSQELWRLSAGFSESDGYFQSENLVSNEDSFQHVIPELKTIVPDGGVYVGVGPDQNFTYIAALKPRMVFITDVRRGNLRAHLMYKALFELSDDRADFLSKLFSRARPDGLGRESTAADLFAAYAGVQQDQGLFEKTLASILDRLRDHHGLPISELDAGGIEWIFQSFYSSGPALSYSTRSRRGRPYPTYQALQVATDLHGVGHSYMATAVNFEFVKSLQERNLIVPVVGNFAGPKALRSIAAYVREHGATVTTFYTSNVEQYLFQDRIWDRFADNVSTFPLEESSTFVRSCFNTCDSPFGTRSVTLLGSIPALMRDFADGKVGSYWAVLNHVR